MLEAEFRSEHLRTIHKRVIASLIVAVVYIAWHVFAGGGDVVPAADAAEDLRRWAMMPFTIGVFALALALVPSAYHRFWLTTVPPVVLTVGGIGAYYGAALVAGGNVHAFVGMMTGMGST